MRYYYVDEDEPDKEDDEYNLVTVMKDGLSKPLDQVMERIDLLGFTMQYARREFEYVSRLNDFDTAKFSFEQLAKALATVDVKSISADYGDGEDFGKFFRRYLFDRLGLDKIVEDPKYVRYAVGEGMENLSAYTIIRLVAQTRLREAFR